MLGLRSLILISRRPSPRIAVKKVSVLGASGFARFGVYKPSTRTPVFNPSPLNFTRLEPCDWGSLRSSGQSSDRIPSSPCADDFLEDVRRAEGMTGDGREIGTPRPIRGGRRVRAEGIK